MKINPLHDNIVLALTDPPKRTAGGLYIPETADNKGATRQGKVIAAGPGLTLENGRRVEPSVKKGDVVYIGRYTGSEVTIDGAEYVIVKESEVLAAVA